MISENSSNILHPKTFTLKPAAPFRLDLTVWALRRRPDNIVDRWDGKTFRRAIVLSDGVLAEMVVQQQELQTNPLLVIKVTSSRNLSTEVLENVKLNLEKTLGMKVDLSGFYDFAADQPRLKPLVELFRGLKPPRFPSVFEALVNGITCQQLTLTLGIQLLNKLAAKYGRNFMLPNSPAFAFPEPLDLCKLEPNDFRALGYSRQKGRAIIELSLEIVEGRLDLQSLGKQDDESILERLREIRGVGPWTSSYVLLRGYGRIDAFPVYDVGGRNGLQKWLEMANKLSVEDTERILSPWKPFAGLLYFHLLLEGLRQRGVIV